MDLEDLEHDQVRIKEMASLWQDVTYLTSMVTSVRTTRLVQEARIHREKKYYILCQAGSQLGGY